jgi:SNF2-related domain
MRAGTLIAAALALGVWPAMAAAQAPQDQGPAESLPVQTVPKLEGARFVLNGKAYRTDASGRVTVPGDGQPGLRDRVQIPATTIAPGLRVEFSRRKEDWFLFNRLVRVRFSFVDLQGRPIPASRVEQITLKGVHGDRVKLKPDRTQWLQSARIVPFKEGFREKQLSWVVEEAIVDGQNVVNKNQQRFEPATTPAFQITLLFYPARVTVRDSFFGFPTGSHVLLKAPNGKIRRYRLGPNGEAKVPSLPRGEYIVTVEGPGLTFEHPLTLSRKQLVDLELLSFLDLAVAFGVLGSIAIGLLWLGGRLPRPADVVRLIRGLAGGPRWIFGARRAHARVALPAADSPPPMSSGDQPQRPAFDMANALGDRWWSGELHLDLGRVAGVLGEEEGAYISWEGDLPKALGACAIIEALETRRTLVVCPNAAKEAAWAAEFRRLLPTHDIEVLSGDKSDRDAMLRAGSLERHSTRPIVLVVQYEALATSVGRSRSGGSTQTGDWPSLGGWDLVVADDAHRFWDPKTLVTRTLSCVSSRRRLALSGSMFQDHPEMLFSVLQWLFPEVPGVHDEAVFCRAEWRDSGKRDNKLAIGLIPAQLETLRRDPGTFEVYRRRPEEPAVSEPKLRATRARWNGARV